MAGVLVSPAIEAVQGGAAHGGWLRGFLEEADRQLGSMCWPDLSAGSPAVAPIYPASSGVGTP
jgi:hypothetical protein